MLVVFPSLGLLWCLMVPWCTRTGSNSIFVAYVMDLRAMYLPLGPLPPSSDQSWRERALHLESQYAALKAEFDAELISELPEYSSVRIFLP